MERFLNVLDILKLTIVLTIVALIAGLAIAFTNAQTEEKIALQQKLSQQTALEAVLPKGVQIIEKSGQAPLPSQYWVAVRDQDTVAYAIKGSNRGYSSSIQYIVGVRPDGEIVGVNILSQSETPGLGTRVTEEVSEKYFWNGLWGPKDAIDPWFTQQFVGLNATEDIELAETAEWHTLSEQQREELKSQNEITAITGATISTQAVSEGVEKTVSKYLPVLTNAEDDQ